MPSRLSCDYEFDCFGINIEHCLLLRDDESIHISPTAFKILQVLVENRHRPVLNSELKGIWESQKTYVEDNNIQHHISKLRNALGLKPDGEPYIKTYRKGAHRKIGGYQFTADVRILSNQVQGAGISVKTDVQVGLDLRSDVEDKANHRKKDAHSDEDHESRNIAIPLRLPSDRISIARLPPTGPDLFGRDNELQLLDDAWSNPNINIVSFVAWGGVGKTALVNHWLKQRMARDNYRGAERVYGWSFYMKATSEQVASADLFIDQALRFFGGDELADKLASASPWDKGEQLAYLIRQTRTLLILDGLEPLQYPPGQGRLKDAAMQALLVELAAEQPGLCVISTRERISDLVEFENGIVIQRELEHLTPQAGAQLLHALHVKGNELEQAAQEYAGHALSLTLLGSYLVDVYSGNIRRRNEIKNLEEDVQHGRHAEGVMRAYEMRLGDGIELAVLRLLGLFDRPADAASIAALRAAPAIPELTEALQNLEERQWQQALAKLRRIKLLGAVSANDPNTLDAHPLVREHFKEQLKRKHPAAWREANNRLYEHLTRTAKELPDTMEEMAPLYAAVAHGCEAGRYQEALDDVYWRRIQRKAEQFIWTQIGVFGTNLAALSNFFVLPWQQPVPELKESDKAFVLMQAGVDLRALGRLQEAILPLQLSLQKRVALKDWKNAPYTSSYLSQTYVRIGDLSQALEIAQQSVKHADDSDRDFWRMASQTVLGDALHQAGLIKESIDAFSKAEALQKQGQLIAPLLYMHPLLYRIQNFYYCELLLDLGQVEEVKERASRTLEVAKQHNWLINIAVDNLTLGRALLLGAKLESTNDITQAAEFLQRAVDGLWQAGQMEFIPHGFLARAALHRFRRDFEWAERDLSEVLRIATRDGMGLHLADYHLELARLHLAQGNRDKAHDHLTTAHEMVERMGYHRRDNEVQELAEKLQ